MTEPVDGAGGDDESAALRDAFHGQLGGQAAGVWAAPGRVNLIGEHVDYNEGLVLPFALAQRTYAAAAPRKDGWLRVRSVQLRGGLDTQVSRLRPPAEGGSGGDGGGNGNGDWTAYVAGVVWVLREQGHPVGGLDLLIDGRVPVGAGLSSSAALECAVAVAAADLFGLDLPADDLARVAQRAENDYVGVPCGLMDQMASMSSTAGHALLFDVRSGVVEQVPFSPQDADLRVAVIDTRVKHSVGEGAYADRVDSCERAAQALKVASLRDVAPAALADALARVPADAAPRVRHVVTEIARVGEAVAALRREDWAGFGRAMTASHVSLRDDFEVSCVELDAAVEAALAAGALGARMTGAGFGGSAIALVAQDRLDELVAGVQSSFAAKGYREPKVIQAAPSEGAGRVG